MLSLRMFPRCINHYLKQSQLHTSVKLMTANDASSSSSSDSSDSDSDKEDKAAKKQKVEQAAKKESDELSSEKLNERLNNLLLKISENSKIKETPYSEQTVSNARKVPVPPPVLTPGVIDVAIKHRRIRFKKTENEKKSQPIEKRIAVAAKDLAHSMGDDTGKTELELLGQILNLKPSEEKEEKKPVTSEKPTEEPSLSDLLSSMKVDKPSSSFETRRQTMAQQVKERFSERSITLSLLNQKSRKSPKRSEEDTLVELNAPHLELKIFQNLPKEESQHVPCMLTWNEMEKREMKLATLITPQNIFQELIQWTDQGKFWHFPINNEQGMEEEEKVHFTEHIFLERHLKDWCPKKGPIRNFMELVCVGLSKNPYLKVEEKIGHITWYKNYFAERKDLLDELGVLDGKAPAAEKQIEA